MSRTPGLYTVTDHVCRECLGRLLQRVDGKDRGAVRCSNCGASHAGDIRELCACSLRLKSGKDMGFRCHVNPKQNEEFPAEIVLKRVSLKDRRNPDGSVQTAIPIRIYKPAFLGES